jgi:hypothetical protein
MINMRDYFQYCLNQVDDTPLYIFDGDFGKRCPEMLHDFEKLDEYFPHDLMHLLDGTRPPHRWLLMGARGSGTDVHRDPPGTSAWNALFSGSKVWAVLHPSLLPSDVLADIATDDEPTLCWFVRALPLIVERHPTKVFVFIQYPGSVLLLPPGWWHAVWNIEDVIGVTENRVTWPTFLHHWEGMFESVQDAAPPGTFLAEHAHRVVQLVADYFGLLGAADSLQWLRLLEVYARGRGLYLPSGLSLCVRLLYETE